MNDMNNNKMNSIKVNYRDKNKNRCARYTSGCSSGCSCGGRCGNFCKCANSLICDDGDNFVFFDDNSYAIYRLGNWSNKYNINLLGIDNEIPTTQITRDQSLKIMEKIRKYNFAFKGVEINGMLGLAIRFSNLYATLKYDSLDELISLEELEYKNIKKELANLKLEDPKNFIELNNEKFLIYKLKENCQGAVMSRPVNNFTREHSTLNLVK